MRLLLMLVLACGFAAAEGDLEDRVKELEKRLEASEQKNEDLERKVGALRSQNEKQLEREIDDYLDATQELAGGAGGTETKKGALLTFYGFLRLDLYYNTGRLNSVIVPVRVLPETGERNNDQFALDVRLTRVGMLFDFGKVGTLAVTGKLEIDFSNFPSGVPESRETPRIRLAHLIVNAEKWMLLLGQEWDVISPLYPNVNHETLMWFAGNLGDRRPMIRFLWKTSPTFTVDTALGLTGATDNRDLDGDGERDGIDSGLPHLQVRAVYNMVYKQQRGEADRGPGQAKKAVIGVWGFVGRLEASDGIAGEEDFLSWTAGLDFTVPLGKFVLRGEAWFGQALSDMRGNAGLSVNTATGEEVKGAGGWFEVVIVPKEEWQFYVGGSIDDPDDADVPAAGVTKNWTTYVGARRHWTKKFRTTFDVIFWETQYEDNTLGNAVRFNIWTSVDF